MRAVRTAPIGLLLAVVVHAPAFAAAPAPNALPAAAVAQAPAGGNAFGTRDPRPCPAVTATPTAAQAAQLVTCSREGQSRANTEYLIDAATVASLTPSRYDPHTQTGFTNMDTAVAPLAIRGSLVAWQCTPVDGPAVMAKYSNVGQNCSRRIERNATGYCYRMRTGAWSCAMNDIAVAEADKQDRLPPPR